jgi:peptide/nickel transport system permease protein
MALGSRRRMSSGLVEDLHWTASESPAAEGGSWRRVFARFWSNRVSAAGLIVVVVLSLVALAAPLVAKLVGHGPNQIFPNATNSFGLPIGPNSQFLFGADQEGRDVLVRCVYGLRTSLAVSLIATGLATLIGVVTGLFAGYFGGWIDTLIARGADIFLSAPIVLIAISLSSVCSVTAKGCLGGLIQPGPALVILILIGPSWPYIARVIRGQTITIREHEFVATARALGASSWQVMFREILPNLTSQITVFIALMIPTNIIFEATLSYLGVGIPQSTPSLGGILSDATNNNLYQTAWWMMVFPGVIVLLITLGFFIVADGLRDALHSSNV